MIIFNQGNDPGRMDASPDARRDRAGRRARPADVDDPGRRHLVRRGRAAGRRDRPATGQIIVDAESDRAQVDQRARRHAHGQPGQHDDRRLAPGLGPRGPGINDNGSGSAFNLELAIQMAKKTSSRPTACASPGGAPRSPAWWARPATSTAISNEGFAQLAANLNFDMLASPNHANLVYDGDLDSRRRPRRRT